MVHFDRKIHTIFSIVLNLREERKNKMIRTARVEDAETINKLNKEEIGYEMPLSETTKQLKCILAQPEIYVIDVYEEEGTRNRICPCPKVCNIVKSNVVQYFSISSFFKSATSRNWQTIDGEC